MAAAESELRRLEQTKMATTYFAGAVPFSRHRLVIFWNHDFRGNYWWESKRSADVFI